VKPTETEGGRRFGPGGADHSGGISQIEKGKEESKSNGKRQKSNGKSKLRGLGPFSFDL
jgi:hypothetical protein